MAQTHSKFVKVNVSGRPVTADKAVKWPTPYKFAPSMYDPFCQWVK